MRLELQFGNVITISRFFYFTKRATISIIFVVCDDALQDRFSSRVCIVQGILFKLDHFVMTILVT